jgi:hypothetical protein
MDASTAFWSEAVGLAQLHVLPSFTFLEAGDVQLILSHLDGGVSDESLTEVVFSVDDVNQAYAEMAARGVPFEVELRPISSDGDRTLLGAHFRDPDGHYGTITGWIEGV